MNAYDLAYGLGLGVSAPVWLVAPKARRKVLAALRGRMGRGIPSRNSSRPAVMIHAVSVGEMNATRELIAELSRRRPELQFVVTVTTETGWEQGKKLYDKSTDVTLVRFPLDFSAPIARLLDGLQPSAVVLMELEVWPNFLRQCQRRRIPVAVVNGRMTTTAYSRYRMIGPVARAMFRKLAAVCAQEQVYAERFVALGAVPGRVRVTGTMKFDTAKVEDRVEGAEEVARAVGLLPGERVWVCGSTGPGEEKICLDVYEELLKANPGLRLVIVPRHPPRFDEVAGLIRQDGFDAVRRSQRQGAANDESAIGNRQSAIPPEPAIRNPHSAIPPVILGDTMGELRKWYSLADVVFVGRSLVDLGPRQHGSDMMEPAGLGKACVVGPFTGNFREVMNAFLAAGAMVAVPDAVGLSEAVGGFLNDRDRARDVGERARRVVLENKGATLRHVQVIEEMLDEVQRQGAETPR